MTETQKRIGKEQINAENIDEFVEFLNPDAIASKFVELGEGKNPISDEIWTKIIQKLFDYAAKEPLMGAFSAKICQMKVNKQLDNSNGQRSPFRDMVLNRCQGILESAADKSREAKWQEKQKEIDACVDEDEKTKLTECFHQEKSYYHRMICGNLNFVRELYQNLLLFDSVVFQSVEPQIRQDTDNIDKHKTDVNIFEEETMEIDQSLVETPTSKPETQNPQKENEIIAPHSEQDMIIGELAEDGSENPGVLSRLNSDGVRRYTRIQFEALLVKCKCEKTLPLEPFKPTSYKPSFNIFNQNPYSFEIRDPPQPGMGPQLGRPPKTRQQSGPSNIGLGHRYRPQAFRLSQFMPPPAPANRGRHHSTSANYGTWPPRSPSPTISDWEEISQGVQLHTAESKGGRAWKPLARDTTMADLDQKTRERQIEVRKVQGLLNKLVPENFEEISFDFIKLDEDENQLPDKTWEDIVDVIFKNAVKDQRYDEIYAKLCQLKVNKQLELTGGQTSVFRDLIVSRCQSLFNESEAKGRKEDWAQKQKDIEACEDGQKKENLIKSLVEEKAEYRRIVFGNINFIGKLYQKYLLVSNVIHYCFVHLLQQNEEEEEEYERAVKLFKSVGQKLEIETERIVTANERQVDLLKTARDQRENPQNFEPLIQAQAQLKKGQDLRKQIGYYFKVLQENQPNMSNRVRFAVDDLIELKKNNWVSVRTAKEGPKMLKQIQSEHELAIAESQLLGQECVGLQQRKGKADNYGGRVFSGQRRGPHPGSQSHLQAHGGGYQGGRNPSGRNQSQQGPTTTSHQQTQGSAPQFNNKAGLPVPPRRPQFTPAWLKKTSSSCTSNRQMQNPRIIELGKDLAEWQKELNEDMGINDQTLE